MRCAAPRALLLLLTANLAIAERNVTHIQHTANITHGNSTELALIKHIQDLTHFNSTELSLDAANGTVIEYNEDGEPVVRKKRTFGDIVFRGLADALGYNVQRKANAVALPPPYDPVPGIDFQADGPPPPPPPCRPPPPPPCGKPPPPPPPPCAKPPPPPPPCAKPPPPPPPCAKPPPPPPPCGKPPPPPPPPCPPPKPKPPPPPCPPPPPPPCPKPPPPPYAKPAYYAQDRLDTNLQLNLNFNRVPATPAPQPADYDAEPEFIPIEPRPSRLPQSRPQVTNRINDYEDQQEEEYLTDNDEERAPEYDDHEDLQESRDRKSAVKDVGVAVDKFWNTKKRKPQKKKNVPLDHYQNVHFGDRGLVNKIQRRNDYSKEERGNSKRIPTYVPEENEEENESTTTTEDPQTPLKPRVLPPTEQHPGHIDTVTVRIPPIYKVKKPKKLHRGRTERPDTDEDDDNVETNDRDHREQQKSRRDHENDRRNNQNGRREYEDHREHENDRRNNQNGRREYEDHKEHENDRRNNQNGRREYEDHRDHENDQTEQYEADDEEQNNEYPFTTEAPRRGRYRYRRRRTRSIRESEEGDNNGEYRKDGSSEYDNNESRGYESAESDENKRRKSDNYKKDQSNERKNSQEVFNYSGEYEHQEEDTKESLNKKNYSGENGSQEEDKNEPLKKKKYSGEYESQEEDKKESLKNKDMKEKDESNNSDYTVADYDYYGNKIPISDNEKYFMQLTIPPPTKDADLARIEEADFHSSERLEDEPEINENERIVDDEERLNEDNEKTNDKGRADERERTDKLSPNARFHETGYENKYVRATNVKVDDPKPPVL